MALTFNAIGAVGSVALIGSTIGDGTLTAIAGITEIGSFVIAANTINNGVIIECNFLVEAGPTDLGQASILFSGATANSLIWNQHAGGLDDADHFHVTAMKDNMTKTEANVVILLGSEAAGDTVQLALGNMFAIGY